MQTKFEDDVFPEKTLQQLGPKYVTTNSRIDEQLKYLPKLPLRYKPHFQKYQTRFRPKYRPNYQSNYQPDHQPKYRNTKYQNRNLNLEKPSEFETPKNKIPSSFLTKTKIDDPDDKEIEFNYLIENKNVILEAPKQESANDNNRNHQGRTDIPPLFHTQADFGNSDKEIEFNYVIENKNLILEVPNKKSTKERFEISPNVEEEKTAKVRFHISKNFFLLNIILHYTIILIGFENSEKKTILLFLSLKV